MVVLLVESVGHDLALNGMSLAADIDFNLHVRCGWLPIVGNLMPFISVFSTKVIQVGRPCSKETLVARSGM